MTEDTVELLSSSIHDLQPVSEENLHSLGGMLRVLEDATEKLKAAYLLGAPWRKRVFTEDALICLVRRCAEDRGRKRLNVAWLSMRGARTALPPRRAK